MFTFEAPYPAIQTTSLLPNPQWSDQEGLLDEVLWKRAMDGTLYTYVIIIIEVDWATNYARSCADRDVATIPGRIIEVGDLDMLSGQPSDRVRPTTKPRVRQQVPSANEPHQPRDARRNAAGVRRFNLAEGPKDGSDLPWSNSLAGPRLPDVREWPTRVRSIVTRLSQVPRRSKA
jgi:hypothetical protein